MDKYSLLHFATGIVAHFWNLDRIEFFIYHVLFEIFENSPVGMALISRLPFWPGGKSVPDAWINILGDNLFALFGHWLMSYLPFAVMGYMLKGGPDTKSWLYLTFRPYLAGLAWVAGLLTLLILLVT